MKRMLSIALLLSLSISSYSQEKRGFFAALGLGLNSTNTTMNIDEIPSGENSDTGITSTVKLGGFLSPSTALYYVREASWVNYNNVSTTAGLMGIGFTQYGAGDSPMYFEGAIGISDITFGWNELVPDASYGGFAMQVGIGLEVTPNLQIGISYLYGSTPDWYWTNVDYETSVIAFKIELKNK